jgi:hypothetical protein
MDRGIGGAVMSDESMKIETPEEMADAGGCETAEQRRIYFDAVRDSYAHIVEALEAEKPATLSFGAKRVDLSVAYQDGARAALKAFAAKLLEAAK